MKLYKYNSDRLKYESVNYPQIFLKIALAYFTIFLFLGLTNPPKVEYITDTEKVLIVEEMNQFSEEALIEEISRLNFKFPHIVRDRLL